MTEVLIKGPSVGVYSEKDQQSTNRPYLWIMRIYSLARNLFMIRYSLARNLFSKKESNIAYWYIKYLYIYIRNKEF